MRLGVARAAPWMHLPAYLFELFWPGITSLPPPTFTKVGAWADRNNLQQVIPGAQFLNLICINQKAPPHHHEAPYFELCLSPQAFIQISSKSLGSYKALPENWAV